MAHYHLTASGNVTVQNSGCRKVLLTVNSALTGTVTLADSVGTVAIVTNPTVGTQYVYYDFAGNVQVNPSATCEITVNTSNTHGVQ